MKKVGDILVFRLQQVVRNRRLKTALGWVKQQFLILVICKVVELEMLWLQIIMKTVCLEQFNLFQTTKSPNCPFEHHILKLNLGPRVNCIMLVSIQRQIVLNSTCLLILVKAEKSRFQGGWLSQKQQILEGNSTLFSKFQNIPPFFTAEIKYLQSKRPEMAPEKAWFNIGDGAIQPTFIAVLTLRNYVKFET